MTKLLAALIISTALYAQMDHEHCAMKPKALSADTIEALQKGDGNGMAMPAELNGYPGPRHILDLGDRLRLTADQRTRIQSIYDTMHAEAVPLGAQILALEGKLDRAFADKSMTSRELERLTSEIAKCQGKLRCVHLRAHMAAKDVLTPAQVVEYTALRHE